VFISLLFF
jgi:tRNA (guanine-N7-)-methyltransferase